MALQQGQRMAHLESWRLHFFSTATAKLPLTEMTAVSPAAPTHVNFNPVEKLCGVDFNRSSYSGGPVDILAMVPGSDYGGGIESGGRYRYTHEQYHSGPGAYRARTFGNDSRGRYAPAQATKRNVQPSGCLILKHMGEPQSNMKVFRTWLNDFFDPFWWKRYSRTFLQGSPLVELLSVSLRWWYSFLTVHILFVQPRWFYGPSERIERRTTTSTQMNNVTSNSTAKTARLKRFFALCSPLNLMSRKLRTSGE